MLFYFSNFFQINFWSLEKKREANFFKQSQYGHKRGVY